MSETIEIALDAATLYADLSGALYWPDESTLIVADLHLEKGTSYAGRLRPQFLPPYDTRATLERLERTLSVYAPRRVICLGDSVHDSSAVGRIGIDDSRRIAAMTAKCNWFWVAGNHDPNPPAFWGGHSLEEMIIGNLVFRHKATDDELPLGIVELSGHFHPKARVMAQAGSVSGRCFAGNKKRLVMPAFGAYTGGLNVLAPSIAGLFGGAFTVWILGRARLFALSSRQLA